MGGYYEAQNGKGWDTSGRMAATVLLVGAFVVTVILNGLAATGIAPFENPTGNVSYKLDTCITPAGWAFSIWGIIYAGLAFIVVYGVTLLFRKIGFSTAWQAGGALSTPFLVILSISLILNFCWLFAWDGYKITGSTILLLLIAVMNCTGICLSSFSFLKAASFLQDTSKVDFWLGIVSLNFMATYTMWTVIAALLNFTIFLQYEINLDGEWTCFGILLFLLVVMLVWFVVEVTVFKFHANPVLAQYFVFVFAMVGIFVANNEDASVGNLALQIVAMVLSSLMLSLRVFLAFYRNRENAMYRSKDLPQIARQGVGESRSGLSDETA
ncbi:uncharacterized protein LOC143036047 [Oratosquilla oratoria]|uniref:uncharacterized protein LOC143036047 n=1 Tax=Oratosquilla oratoria TaxID=337810 RepID=UPI003F75BBBA